MIILHIGLRKAGSASLQAFLAANEEPLRRRGFDYPRIGRNGPLARTAHLNLALELRGIRRFDPAYGSLGQLADHRRASPAPTLILSSEMFEDCSAEEAGRLGRALRRGDEEVRVFLVLRDLAALMASSYGQKVKFGIHTHDFDAFLARRIGERRVDYFATARQWARAFGWGALRVHALGAGDLLEAFAAMAGLETAGLARPGDLNLTPGWRVLEAVRALALGTHGAPPAHPLAAFADLDRDARRAVGEAAMAVGEANGWNADRGRYLTAAQLDACDSIQRRAIERLDHKLAARLALPAPAREPRDFLPDAAHIDGLAAFYDSVAAEWRAVASDQPAPA